MRRITIISVMLMMYHFALTAQQSFTLEQAIEYAIDNSDEIKLDYLDIEDANQSVREFKSIGLPQIDANLNYQYNIITTKNALQDFISPTVYEVLFDEDVLERRDLGPPESFEVSFQTKQSISAGINASSLLFDGSYLVGLRAARLYKELTKKSLKITEQEIKSNITKAYMACLILEKNISILENNISTISKTRDEAEALYNEGFIEQIDLLRQDLNLNNIKSEKQKLDQNLLLSKNVLKFQMNYPFGDEISLTDQIETFENTFSVYDTNLQELDYNNRAEYDQILTGQELNYLDLKRIKKGNLPSLVAQASLSGSLQRNELFNSDEVGLLPASFVGLGVRLPIYDGNERKAQVQRRKIKIDQTEIEKQQFEKAVNMQFENAKLNFNNALTALNFSKQSLALAEDIYSKTSIKYSEGVGSSLEVNQAELSLFQSQSNYINALYDLLNAKIEIEIALGTL